MNDECSRCGGPVDDGDLLIVLAIDERDFDPDKFAPTNPGPIHATYCERCTCQIEKQHERHDAEVEAFRAELDKR
jgi:hypothetical protein